MDSRPVHPDLQLVRRALSGDPADRERLFERLVCAGRFLVAKNERMGSPFNPKEMEDLGRETLLEVWRTLDGYPGRGDLEAWVYRASSRSFVSKLRKQGRMAPSLLGSRGPGPSEDDRKLMEAACMDALEATLETLKPAEVEALRAQHRRRAASSAADSAPGLAAGTERERYYRSLRKLRVSAAGSQAVTPEARRVRLSGSGSARSSQPAGHCPIDDPPEPTEARPVSEDRPGFCGSRTDCGFILGALPAMETAKALHPADLELATQALSGVPEARDEFARRMACVPRIVRSVQRRMSVKLSSDESSDLAQEVLVRLWAKLDTFEGRASLESWALRFVFLEIRNVLRRLDRNRDREVEGVEELQTENPETISPEAYAFLMQSLEELDPPAPDVLRLRHHEQLTFDQIGEQLGIPGNTAKTIYHRNLVRLRAKLAPRLGEEFQ